MLENYFEINDLPIIGYITELNYDTAVILSHDYNVTEANFVPKNSFLLVQVEQDIKQIQDIRTETIALLLLRVVNISYVDSINKTNKENTIQRIPSENGSPIMFQKKSNDHINQCKLSFYQLNCNILGTFHKKGKSIHFGSDAYSFSVAHIYKVYKPVGNSLEKIVNFIKEDRLNATYNLIKELTGREVELNHFEIGKVRYASSLIENELSQNNKAAKVFIHPSDFIKQKTGVFGMTRTGKSNTVKILVSSIMNLSKEINTPIGQIIYDINGEYANDNEQNNKITDKNLYTVDNKILLSQKQFNPALNNFYFNPNYGIKVIQNGIKNQNKDSNYLNSFLAIKNIQKSPLLFILWITLLYRSDYEYPKIGLADTDKIIIEDKKIAFGNYGFRIVIPANLYKKISDKDLFEKKCFGELKNNSYLLTLNEEYINSFKNKLLKGNNAQNLLEIIESEEENNSHYSISLLSFITQLDFGSTKKYAISGWQMIVSYQYCHCSLAGVDYMKSIYEKLINGETVIIDFSIGDPFTRKYIADELMQYIFDNQIDKFRIEKNAPIINVFIEEAHNVIGGNADMNSLWPRIAKEGAKYNIGLIYATQEPSAIHDSILSNTANFVIAHLNNEKEIKTISQYQDIGHFFDSIKKSEDVGFVRLKLLSKPYTIPVQINKFENIRQKE